jgi:diguanylate cyclase (GGDEF)-like protein/PAS domain S-box-containing protein
MGSWLGAKRQEGAWQKEHHLLHRNGDLRWVQVAAVPVRDSWGKLLRYVGTIVDLTEQKEALKKLAESEEKFRLIFEKSAVGMNLIAGDGQILDPNPAFCSFLGYSQSELRAMNVKDLIHPEELALAEQALISLCGSESCVAGERRFTRKDGATVWGEVASVWVPGNKELGFGVCIIQDITRKKETQARLEYLDHHDELTGLPNRALLLDRLEQSLHYARRSRRLVAVMLLDIDRFKVINDSLGYASGSKLLCAVAQRLRQAVRETDTVARLGGDEFAILATEVAELDDVGQLATKILRHLSQPLEIEGREIIPTASLGVSLYPRDSENGDTLIRHADLAMYRAKSGGGNGFSFFAPEMNQRAQNALELESDLRQALSRGEFCLRFQPKVSLANGRIIGCEALVRWNHPQRGMVSPADFIPLAEETGLIVPLGTWVLKEACRQNKAWQDEGRFSMRVAVNISARQFRNGDLSQLIQQILEETRLDPQWLEVELTESMIMNDPDQAVSIMTDLKRIGIHLSLDDFGTGYSSLAYLSRFPIDSLKIDKSFVNSLVTDPGSAMIATSIIALAHRMRLGVVAEGVETESQLGYLRRNGCDEMQGYYFSKPVSGLEIAELLRHGKRLELKEDTSDAPTLLIVDDEPGILSALRRLLLDEGYRVLTTESARGGLELLAQNAVQVIITDQRMQGMCGTEFLGQVKALYPNTVRLILSGYADLPTVTQSVNEGALYKFLVKPWDDDQLRDQIRDAFAFYETNIKPRRDLLPW